MKTLCIKNGMLFSPVNGYRGQIKDILVEDGKIVQMEEKIEGDFRVVDASGCLVTPGLIDIHTHCYPDTFLGIAPDVLGIERGVTAIVDAGSSGADNYEHFRKQYIEKSKTKVYSLLNLSKEGLIRGHELDDPAKIDLENLKRLAEQHRDNIVGLKVRASGSVVGQMGMKPLRIGVKTARELKLPLTVHVGNYPPALTEVLELLNCGDVVTHAFHGKKGGILTEANRIIPEALSARERGVLFDIGHGAASFSFRVYKKALADGFDCDLISSDLHQENYNGPVYNLPSVITKVINCGEKLEDAVTKCTSAPARYYGLKNIGEIAIGYTADFNIMELVDTDERVSDSIGDTIELKQKLIIKKTIYSRGKESEIFKHVNEGS